jgi:hypothetical protein
MRLVASVQAKRGSSRGLVHYIAHSKLDTEREPEKTRELFNEFADSLSVESANNSMRIGIARGRPSNDELHHVVLSFRPDDYRALGTNGKQRRRAVKDTTRAAMKQLEKGLGADRLSWAAAVHLNTENPHVHIAIQREYFTKEIERRVMTRVPREALPHFELRDTEKVLVPGLLIESATVKMDDLIERERGHIRTSDRDTVQPTIYPPSSSENPVVNVDHDLVAERDILRRGLLAKHELRRIDTKITALIEHGDQRRFLVSDPLSGERRRLSLADLAQRGSGSATDPGGSPTRQIRTILFKMLAKEEAAKAQLQNDEGDTMREADRIRNEYRNKGRKLPVPPLTKDELDKMQDNCLGNTDVREFSYLERIRSELEQSGDIRPRSKADLQRIAAQKRVSDLRAKYDQRHHYEMASRSFYRFVLIDDRRVSLAQLDRMENPPKNPTSSFVEKVKETAARLSGKARGPGIGDDNDRIKIEIVNKLNEELEDIKKDQKGEQNKARILEKILTKNLEHGNTEPAYSPEQLAEVETLSLRLKERAIYEENWDKQRALIDSAREDCEAYRKLIKADPGTHFDEYKNNIAAGRAVAREIVAKVEYQKAKESLETFKKSKRFQKVGVADKTTDTVAFFSLHDVDLSSRGSLLDRALSQLLEGREHRLLRRTVTSLLSEREQRLNNEVTAAKGILAAALSSSSEFKQFSLFSLKSEVTHQPIFTSSEVMALENRAANMHNPKEAVRLRAIIESSGDRPHRHLSEILRDFADPEVTPDKGKTLDSSSRPEKLSLDRTSEIDGNAREPEKEDRSVLHPHNHLRR